MRYELKRGTSIALGDRKYTIEKVIGYGASCIVYDASYFDSLGLKHIVRLKEFYPIKLDITRDESQGLVVGESDRASFEKLRAIFLDSYNKNVSFQNEMDTANSTSTVYDIYDKNGTVYIAVNYDNGITYDKVEGESLHEIFKICLSISKTIAKYHEHGYLHLDIKPENIFKIPETNELVILFDFGSLASIEDLRKGNIKAISYSETWAAPEQLQQNLKKVGKHSDIYSIGAIVFYKVMGRKVSVQDRGLFAKWKFDRGSSLFENCNPKLFKLLGKLFKKTLASSVNKRYREVRELISDLEKLVELSRPNSIYLNSNFVMNDSLLVGRIEEIEEIHDNFKKTNTVFLSGFGGIGKSVIAKKYAYVKDKEYDVVVFARYVSSLRDLIISDIDLPIVNFSKNDDEDDEKYYKRKLKKLGELADKKTLIIIDNFDVEEDDDLEDVISCGAKFIFTTRYDFSDYNYCQLDIEEFKNDEDILELFYKYNDKDYSSEDMEVILDIIEIVDRHTMTVELIAKQLRSSRMTPGDLYEKFSSIEGVTSARDDKLKLKKDRRLNNKTIMQHLEILFDVAKLGKLEKYILMNLSLLANIKIDEAEFMKWCDIDESNKIKVLVDKGWIEYNDEALSLHQIIIDLIYNKLKPSSEKCQALTIKMAAMASEDFKKNYEKRKQYIKLLTIFGNRIRGKDLNLARFYRKLAILYSIKNKDNSFEFFRKSLELYEALDEKDEDYESIYYEIGNAYCIKLNNADFMLDDEEIDDIFDNMISSFDKYAAVKLDKNKKMQAADEYIKIAKALVESYEEFNMYTDYVKENYAKYIEKCLVTAFNIKRELLGANHLECKDLSYALYRYYTGTLCEYIDEAVDKEKALYYGEIYIGEL